MTFDPHALAERVRQLGEQERKVIAHLVHRKTTSRDRNQVYDEGLTFGERIADRVAAFGGSWTFILLFLGMMLVWITANIVTRHPFDVYPFILLNLVLSMLAALQAPVIMMSQNRQSAKDRQDAAHDYEVNLKAELEIMALHAKFDELRQQQWKDLLETQERQLKVLADILAKLPR